MTDSIRVAAEQARVALQMALTGLQWYRGHMPEYVDGSDAEADDEISAALASLEAALAALPGDKGPSLSHSAATPPVEVPQIAGRDGASDETQEESCSSDRATCRAASSPLPSPSESGRSALPQRPPSVPYLCPDGCGCMWRDNGDGTMSLRDGSQRSCDDCERLPLSKLKRMTVHDNLFIEDRGDGAWLVCLDKVHSTMEEAQRACRAWIEATTPRQVAHSSQAQGELSVGPVVTNNDRMNEENASPVAPAGAPRLTDEQIDALIEAHLHHLTDAERGALTFTRWKDGIDCEYPTVGARKFARALLSAGSQGEQHDSSHEAAPQSSVASPAPRSSLPPPNRSVLPREPSLEDAYAEGRKDEAEHLQTTKLWLWKNGPVEFWAFDNPYPTRMDCGDPQTLGEPCGYALFKPSRDGSYGRTEEEVLRKMSRGHGQENDKC